MITVNEVHGNVTFFYVLRRNILNYERKQKIKNYSYLHNI